MRHDGLERDARPGVLRDHVGKRPNKEIRKAKGDELRAMRSGVVPPQITPGCAMTALSGSQVPRSRKVM